MRPGDKVEFSQVALRLRAGSYTWLGSPLWATILRVNECRRGDFDPHTKVLFTASFFIQNKTGVSGPFHCPNEFRPSHQAAEATHVDSHSASC